MKTGILGAGSGVSGILRSNKKSPQSHPVGGMDCGESFYFLINSAMAK